MLKDIRLEFGDHDKQSSLMSPCITPNMYHYSDCSGALDRVLSSPIGPHRSPSSCMEDVHATAMSKAESSSVSLRLKHWMQSKYA